MAKTPRREQDPEAAMRHELQQALADLGLPERAHELMAAHWRLVMTWQQRVNLTAILDAPTASWLHYRDSLEALRLLPDGPMADLGSGAGFPGIPLAIAQPQRRVTLVEPRRKRASFLETVVARLGLANVTVLHARSDDGPPEPYAAVVTRATFSTEQELRSCLGWVAAGGVLVAYRAPGEPLRGATLHDYSLAGQARCLAVVRAGA